MPRVVILRGKRVVIPVPSSPVHYATLLFGIVRKVRDGYLQLAHTLSVSEVRTDAKQTVAEKLLHTRRKPLYNVLQETDRSRHVTEHGIRAIVDSVVAPEELSPLLDNLGHATVSHGNREFSALIQEQANGRPLKTAIRSIDLRSIASNAGEMVRDFRTENLDLITALVSSQVEDLEGVLEEGQGLHVRDLTDRIQQATGTTERHATLLARDQTLKLNADVQQTRAENVGATSFIWVTSNDERVRGRPGGKWANSQSDHWDLQGRSFEYLNPPITNPVTGARNLPGQDYQCRCTASPDLSHIFGPDDPPPDA